MKTNQKLIRRYSMERHMWEVGYYISSTTFYVVRYEPIEMAS